MTHLDMKHFGKLLAVFLLFAGCAKKTTAPTTATNSPADVVNGYFQAMEARDSSGVLSLLSSDLKEMVLKPGDSSLIRLLKRPNNVHWTAKVLGVSQDSMTPSLAKVYANVTYTKDTSKFNSDSVYYYVSKENEVWKLTTFRMYKDK
ncbi:MAG TPA: hypothetical protein VEW28_08250 [Candidatus Kapabacteria bacterium]|nr:hypothetical protein [Candidatus Kapabacteria bacterium]